MSCSAGDKTSTAKATCGPSGWTVTGGCVDAGACTTVPADVTNAARATKCVGTTNGGVSIHNIAMLWQTFCKPCARHSLCCFCETRYQAADCSLNRILNLNCLSTGCSQCKHHHAISASDGCATKLLILMLFVCLRSCARICVQVCTYTCNSGTIQYSPNLAIAPGVTRPCQGGRLGPSNWSLCAGYARISCSAPGPKTDACMCPRIVGHNARAWHAQVSQC